MLETSFNLFLHSARNQDSTPDFRAVQRAILVRCRLRVDHLRARLLQAWVLENDTSELALIYSHKVSSSAVIWF